jgi:hypothetical protein
MRGADASQLRLLDAEPRPEWRLDDRTRAVGLRGVERARAALQGARRLRVDLSGGASGDGSEADPHGHPADQALTTDDRRSTWAA